MGVTLGIAYAEDATGWTTFTASEPSGEGSDHVGNGTRIIYVSSSTGSNANKGTLASPKQTLAAGIALLRDGYPDWLLLKKGDTWTETPGFIAHWGRSEDEPLRLGAYDTGARPKIKVADGATSGYGIRFSGSRPYIAVTGLHITCYKKDPNDAGYDATEIVKQMSPLGFLFGPQDWILVEDCRLSYGQLGLGVVGATKGTVIVRRNIVENCYDSQLSHNGGMYIEAAQSFRCEENICIGNGYSKEMYVPGTVTMTIASPTVVTWTGHKVAEGSQVRLHSTTGAFPTGLALATDYFVKNLSGDTFNLSTTRNGSTLINTTGSQSGTHKMIFEDVGPTLYNQTVYIQSYEVDPSGVSVSWPVSMHGNIYIDASAHGAECPPGGEIHENLCVRVPNGILAAGKGNPLAKITDFVTHVTLNVILEGIAQPNDPLASDNNRAQGIDVGSNTGTVHINKNIVAHQAQVSDVNATPIFLGDTPITKTDITENIIYDWRSNGANVVDGVLWQPGQAAGNVRSPNAFDPTGANTAGYADPTRSVGSYLTTLSIAPGTTDQFVTELLLQSKDNWRPTLMAHRVNDYIRGGFGQRRRLTVNWDV